MPVASDQFAGLSAEVLKVQTFEILQQMLLNDSRQQPLVLAVENLHWIDPTSEEFLTSLVERLAGVPVLLLATYRPGYRPPWLEKSYAMQIALTPLGPDDSRQVMRSVLRQTSLEPVLEQQLLAKAQGNPLFSGSWPTPWRSMRVPPQGCVSPIPFTLCWRRAWTAYPRSRSTSCRKQL